MRMRLGTIVVSGMLLLASCSLTDPTATLSLTISGNTSTLPVGGVLHVTVNAVNVSDKSVTLSAPSACLLFMQVRDVLTGALTYSSNDQCSGNPETVTIAPGDVRTATFDWDGTGLTGVRLPTGSYAIRGGAEVIGKTLVSSPVVIFLE
jgi:hypothetical protein